MFSHKYRQVVSAGQDLFLRHRDWAPCGSNRLCSSWKNWKPGGNTAASILPRLWLQLVHDPKTHGRGGKDSCQHTSTWTNPWYKPQFGSLGLPASQVYTDLHSSESPNKPTLVGVVRKSPRSIFHPLLPKKVAPVYPLDVAKLYCYLPFPRGKNTYRLALHPTHDSQNGG